VPPDYYCRLYPGRPFTDGLEFRCYRSRNLLQYAEFGALSFHEVSRAMKLLRVKKVRTEMCSRALPWISLLSLVLSTLPAIAQTDLYDNGPTDGQDNAWTINFGYAVSDSFTLGSNSNVNGLTFTAWLFGNDILTSAEVTITSSEFGGTTYFDQMVNFTQSNCALNQDSFNVCTETGNFGTGVNLSAGTYWLTLSNAETNTLNDPVWWDQNGGPSSASENSLGTIPSESFTVLGSSGSSTGTTPEPGSLVLFVSGMLTVLRWSLRS
jgi:hypothetical protein